MNRILNPISQTEASLSVGNLPGLDTTCVDLSRRVKLSIIKLKLWQWGESVHINEKIGPSADEKNIQAQEILAEISQLFISAEKNSQRFCSKARADVLVVCDNGTDLKLLVKSLLLKVESIVELHQNRTSRVKKNVWVLDEKKEIEELIDNVKGLVNDLVELFPTAQEYQREKTTTEVKELAKIVDEKILPTMMAAIGEDGVMLRKTGEETITSITKGVHTSENTVFNNYGGMSNFVKWRCKDRESSYSIVNKTITTYYL